jgi:uncharacterized hydrophobic protein (TIGR00341 family)
VSTLRMMEIIVPESDIRELNRMLEEAHGVEPWSEILDNERGRVRVLLPTGRTEEVMDLLQQRFGMKPEFRVMLLAVQATLPKLEEEKPPPEEKKEKKPELRTPNRVSREELYETVAGGAKLTSIFLLTVTLSTLVAAIGLARGDVAIIIGAMVIAPLLGPNVAMALAVTLGDSPLLFKSMRTLTAGIALATVVAVVFGVLIQVDPASPQLAARTALGLSDLLLALAAGVAGALAFTSGLPAALIGVMVAVALLPPLVTAGLMLGAGRPDLAIRATALFTTNVACVNLAGVVTFLFQRIRPRTWWEGRKARKATRWAIVFWAALIVLLGALIRFFWNQ